MCTVRLSNDSDKNSRKGYHQRTKAAIGENDLQNGEEPEPNKIDGLLNTYFREQDHRFIHKIA